MTIGDIHLWLIMSGRGTIGGSKRSLINLGMYFSSIFLTISIS